MNKFLAILTAIAIAHSWTSAVAAPGTLLRTFLSPDRPNTGNGFGTSVATIGDDVLISDPYYSGGGRVYRFDAATGALVQTISNPTPRDGDRFGLGIRAFGTDILIGAPYDGPTLFPGYVFTTGAAYLFDGVTGALKRTFQEPGPTSSSDTFGNSFATIGNSVIVGATNPFHGPTMFDGTTGTVVRSFPNPSPDGIDFYGEHVDASGGTVFVAGPQNVGSSDIGTVYQFNATTGALIHTFEESSAGGGSRFGSSIAAANGRLLVGDPGSYNSGAAYLYDSITGDLLRTFPKQNPSERTFYGDEVAIIDSLAVVGAFTFQHPGAAYIFDMESGALELTLREPPGRNEGFGYALAPLGGNLVVGSPSMGSGNPGAVYLFEVAIVPEPDSVILAGVGALILLAFAAAHLRQKIDRPRKI